MLSNLVKDIYRAIPRDKRAPELRLSAIGQPCERRLWYSVNSPELEEPISGEQKLRFEYGNILERTILEYVRAAGYRVELEQHEVEIGGVKGHIDCLINGCLVDVKSASNYGFKKFKYSTLQAEDPFGYTDQINAYHFALREHPLLLDKERVYFLAIDKSNGEIVLDGYPINGKDYSLLVEGKKAIVGNVLQPDRGYQDIAHGVSGNRKLGTACAYCPFKQTCWPNLQAFSYAGGSTYFTHITKKPRVQAEEQF